MYCIMCAVLFVHTECVASLTGVLFQKWSSWTKTQRTSDQIVANALHHSCTLSFFISETTLNNNPEFQIKVWFETLGVYSSKKSGVSSLVPKRNWLIWIYFIIYAHSQRYVEDLNKRHRDYVILIIIIMKMKHEFIIFFTVHLMTHYIITENRIQC